MQPMNLYAAKVYVQGEGLAGSFLVAALTERQAEFVAEVWAHDRCAGHATRVSVERLSEHRPVYTVGEALPR